MWRLPSSVLVDMHLVRPLVVVITVALVHERLFGFFSHHSLQLLHGPSQSVPVIRIPPITHRSNMPTSVARRRHTHFQPKFVALLGFAFTRSIPLQAYELSIRLVRVVSECA